VQAHEVTKDHHMLACPIQYPQSYHAVRDVLKPYTIFRTVSLVF